MKFTQKLQQCLGGAGAKETAQFYQVQHFSLETVKKKTEAIKEEAKESRHFQKEDVPKAPWILLRRWRADKLSGAQPSSRTIVKTTPGEQRKPEGRKLYSIEWASDKSKCGSERKRQEHGLE